MSESSEDDVFVESRRTRRQRKKGICVMQTNFRPQFVQDDSSSDDGQNSPLYQHNFFLSDDQGSCINKEKAKETTDEVDTDWKNVKSETLSVHRCMADVFANDSPKRGSVKFLRVAKKRIRKLSVPERPCSNNSASQRRIASYLVSSIVNSAGICVLDCGVNVHENSCKDQIAQCSKFRNTKVSYEFYFYN